MKKLQLSDYIIIGLVVILLCVGAFITIRHKKVSGLPETADKKIFFQVMIRGVSLTDNILPFQEGDDSFITIRNVPYTKLKIAGVGADNRKKIISANNENGFIVVSDVSVPFLFDLIVTLQDNAKLTSDGYVVGGNKLKIGVPVTIEGPKYRFNGTVSNIKSAEEIAQMQTPEQQEKPQEAQK